jgi:hypothetical protein
VFAERGSFRPGSSGFRYRLRRCEGLRVDSPHARVSFVEEPRYGSRVVEPDALAVRAGTLSAGLLPHCSRWRGGRDRPGKGACACGGGRDRQKASARASWRGACDSSGSGRPRATEREGR